MKTARRGTFVPLVFVPGEAFQFDWSEDWAVIAGERAKLQMAQFKLNHSRAFVSRAYLLQTQSGVARQVYVGAHESLAESTV
jgi:hypothetical protein